MLNNLIRTLSDCDIERIHKESLQVLERVGMHVPNETVLRACRKSGAAVNEASNTMQIHSSLMEQLLAEHKNAPKPFEHPIRKLSGNISTQVFIVDFPGHARRKGTLADVRRGIMVSDALGNIKESNAVVIPGDLPYPVADIASFREIYLYSKKPGGTYILSPMSCRSIIEMSRAIGKEICYTLNTISPLAFSVDSLEMALIFAEEKKPLYPGSMVIGGATGPVTLWGNAVLHNAEQLGTLFIIYALTGQMSGYSGGNHTMDMRTAVCSFGSPNQALLGIVAAQMARFYGWQCGSNSALSDACLPDYQCGFEKAFTGLFSILAGCTGIGCQGIVGADQGVSLEQLVLDNDWLDAYNYVLKGIEPDSEALELIEKVGIGGNFISEEHTVTNMRRNYWEAPSGAFWRDQWEVWQGKGTGDIYERAHAFVEKSTHEFENMEPVLEPSLVDQVEEIYEDAYRRLKKIQ